jgi:hypothetical protein
MCSHSEQPAWLCCPTGGLHRDRFSGRDNATSHRPIAPLRHLLEGDPRLAVTTLEIGKGELVTTRTS